MKKGTSDGALLHLKQRLRNLGRRPLKAGEVRNSRMLQNSDKPELPAWVFLALRFAGVALVAAVFWFVTKCGR
ncbi:hypothetical protein GCM10011383_30640 [Hymenobacter cavernae]|uniref:Uncharacterized protein n=1 Tax=Hymenobacter cavernae TaxID=2044852 RepID=A0ABQ1UE93_9BACT|nr:hypothetical protein GCM10011383_30640 [Hymenobacter cavernae]